MRYRLGGCGLGDGESDRWTIALVSESYASAETGGYITLRDRSSCATATSDRGDVQPFPLIASSSTVWLVPLMVAGVTAARHSQQAGFVPLPLMLVAGAVILPFVRGGDRWRSGVDEEIPVPEDRSR